MDNNRHKVNFYVYYEIDDDEVKHVLRNCWYNGEEEGSWVLLEEVDSEPPPDGTIDSYMVM